MLSTHEEVSKGLHERQGLLANIGAVYDKQIPSLVIAADILPLMASIFALMLLASIYTTAVPMLWTACNRITANENSKTYKMGAIVLIVIACFGGQLQFAWMVGVVYPATGYMGLLLIAGMIYTKYVRKSQEATGRETAR